MSGLFGQYRYPSNSHQHHWALRIYKGYATYRPLMAIITYGDVPRERHDTGIRGIDLSRTMIRNWRGLPLDWSLRAGFIRHNEMGYQPNHNQYTLFFQGHYYRITTDVFWVSLFPFLSGKDYPIQNWCLM